jgi:cytoskeletal protein CcmA (bactofilin family)
MADQLGGPAGPAPSTAPTARTFDPRGGAPAAGPGRRAVVGAASALRGQLAAREDVWIDGQLEGEVQAPAHQVTVGTGGRVKADVKARAVVVEGELLGNVVAREMVAVRTGGRVVGDVRAPRVVLEDGCQFQGTVDMEGTPAGNDAAGTPPSEGERTTATTDTVAPMSAETATLTAPAMIDEGKG